jgi:hypothetical protein
MLPKALFETPFVAGKFDRELIFKIRRVIDGHGRSQDAARARKRSGDVLDPPTDDRILYTYDGLFTERI